VILVQIEESRGKYEEDVIIMGLNEYYYRLLYKPLVAAEPS
jgi:hypothetical protein